MSGEKGFCTENMIVDTTVWVHFFRREEKSKEFLLSLREEIAVSRITIMELVYGRRSKKDIGNMRRQFKNLDVRVEEINEGISTMAGEIFEKYCPTKGIGLLDAFVAATAIVHGKKLATHNTKHFRFIKGLELVVLY